MHMLKKNLDYVVSGKVTLKNLPGDSIGMYYKTPDEIGIDPRLSTNERTFKVLIHEFAHKLWFSFLSDTQRQQFKNIYKEKKKEFGLDQPKIQIGDILEYEGDDDSLDGTWKAVRYHGQKLEIRTDDWKLIQHPYNFLRGGFKIINRETPKFINKPIISHKFNNNTDMWFPTIYSETNLSEWFAETFTLWLLDQLQGEPKEFFDKIIKGA